MSVLPFDARDLKQSVFQRGRARFVVYGVTFPMMEKVRTKGPEQAPIYRTLTAESPEGMRGEIAWNFTKFLVGGDGEVVARFEPGVDPMDEAVLSAVEGLLAADG